MSRFLIVLPLWLALRAAPAAAGETCGAENLLAGREPAGFFDAFRPQMLTDGLAAREGDPELGALSAVLASNEAFIEYDLGAPRRLTAVLLQVAGRSRFVLDASTDRQAWQPLLVMPPSGEAGLRLRADKALDRVARYLRLTGTGPSGVHAVAELQVFCRPPASPPVAIRPASEPVPPHAVALEQARANLLLLLPVGAALLLLAGHDGTRRRARLALVVAGAGFVLALAVAARGSAPRLALLCGGGVALAAAAASWAAARRSSGPGHTRLRGAAAALLVGVAAMAYTNYGRFAGYWSVHYHDALHYTLGAKYAPELRYDGLYACLFEASSVEPRWTSARPPAVRDLRAGSMIPAARLGEGPPCRERFAPERWRAFRTDAAFLATQLSPAGWVGVFADHGYNATPVWTWLWRPWLARPASVSQLEALAHVDELAYALMALVALWAWGPARGATAAVLLGFGFPWIHLWTGGGIGRSLWLVALVVALALVSRRRFAWAGIPLGVAAALQAFPVLLLAGPALLAWRRDAGREAASARRLLLATTASGAALVALSFQVAGPSLWLDFARNTLKHMQADSANRLGSTMIAVGAGAPGWVGWLLAAATLGVWLGTARRVRDPARALALALLVPVFALRLSSYYLALVVGLAPLLETRRRLASALVALLVIPLAVAWTLGAAVGPGAHAAMSAAIVGFGLALCVLERRRSEPALASEAPPR